MDATYIAEIYPGETTLTYSVAQEDMMCQFLALVQEAAHWVSDVVSVEYYGMDMEELFSVLSQMPAQGWKVKVGGWLTSYDGVHFDGHRYSCDTPLIMADYLHLYDKCGNTIAVFGHPWALQQYFDLSA